MPMSTLMSLIEVLKDYAYYNCLRELFHRNFFRGSFWVNKSRDIVFLKKFDLKSVWVKA